MAILKFVGIATCLGFVSVAVRSVSKEYSVLVSIASSVVLLSLVLGEALGLYERFTEFLAKFETEGKLILTCGKIIGIAYLAEISANVLESAEEKHIADKIRIFGKVAVFSSCMPMFYRFADVVLNLL